MGTNRRPGLTLEARLAVGGRTSSGLEHSLFLIGAVCSGAVAALTAAWIVVMLIAPNPPAGATPSATLSFIQHHDDWQVISFVIVAPIALLQVPLWVALAAVIWRSRPALSVMIPLIGLTYAPFTLWSYWSQISIVRGLAELQRTSPTDAVAAFQVLQFSSDRWSAAYASDVLGYVIWGSRRDTGLHRTVVDPR